MDATLAAMCLRDPQQTDLGRRILSESIRLIDQRGLEDFTFKRLAAALETAEASVYRYFENKHRLLNYLVSWYWQWLDTWVEEEVRTQPPDQRLQRILAILAHAVPANELAPPYLEALYRIVVAEASKSYLTKAVDQENRDGMFRWYKSLCGRVAGLLQEANPTYPYPRALASTLVEAARKQVFFAQHLPSLTEVPQTEATADAVSDFLLHLATSAIHANLAHA